MSVYPGNSGGPVIGDDKLVGIVVEQAEEPILESQEQLQVGIPFGRLIKAKYLFELLGIQEKKDSK